MRKYMLFIILVFISSITSLLAQEVCESDAESMTEDLNSITKCTIDKKEETNSSGKKTKKLSVKISSSTRFLRRRKDNKEVSSIEGMSSSGLNAIKNQSTDLSNKLSLGQKSNNFKRLKESLSKEQLKKAFEFEDLDQIPLFKACENKSKEENAACFNENMIAHIQKHFRYPNKAIIGKIEGNVWVRFVIDEEGSITNFKAVAPKEAEILKHEATRVVSQLLAFKPPVKKGKKVLAKYGFPINFSLEN